MNDKNDILEGLKVSLTRGRRETLQYNSGRFSLFLYCFLKEGEQSRIDYDTACKVMDAVSQSGVDIMQLADIAEQQLLSLTGKRYAVAIGSAPNPTAKITDIDNLQAIEIGENDIVVVDGIGNKKGRLSYWQVRDLIEKAGQNPDITGRRKEIERVSRECADDSAKWQGAGDFALVTEAAGLQSILFVYGDGAGDGLVKAHLIPAGAKGVVDYSTACKVTYKCRDEATRTIHLERLQQALEDAGMGTFDVVVENLPGVDVTVTEDRDTISAVIFARGSMYVFNVCGDEEISNVEVFDCITKELDGMDGQQPRAKVWETLKRACKAHGWDIEFRRE